MATLSKTKDGVCEISMKIDWKDVKSQYDQEIDAAVKKTTIAGFRQGKAPRNIVEQNLDKSKIYEQVIQTLIPKMYDTAINDLKLRPIMMPKIELQEAEEGKDWVVIARTCEKPDVILGDYKTKIHDINVGKQKKIWLPGQAQDKDEKEKKDKKISLDELLDAIYSVVKIELPSVLLIEEVNRMLSDLIDQTKKIGLTVDQYLSSTNRNSDSIKAEYTSQAQKTLTLEFALEAIANTEKITVSDADIQKTIDNAKDDQEKEAMAKQKYYIASILRRRKTIDFLTSL
jgi:FKBP-type peptidyl-prolyl cis-trans isomerase (trigger factor)